MLARRTKRMSGGATRTFGLPWHCNDFNITRCCCKALCRISPERDERCLKLSSLSSSNALPGRGRRRRRTNQCAVARATRALLPFISKSVKFTSPSEYSSMQYSIHFWTSAFDHESMGWTTRRQGTTCTLVDSVHCAKYVRKFCGRFILNVGAE